MAKTAKTSSGMHKVMLAVGLILLILLVPASGETAVLGSYKLNFAVPGDFSRSEYDTPLALENETIYSYGSANSGIIRSCVFRLHDRLVPCDFETINSTLLYWLEIGTARVKSWNASAEGTILYQGQGITNDGAFNSPRRYQAYAFARPIKATQNRSMASAFIVLKTVGLTRDEAENVFSSAIIT